MQTGSIRHTLWGYEGDDLLSVYGEGSVMYGGLGHDTIGGAIGGDTLYGDEGNDLIRGNNGNDLIYGGAGNDTLFGNNDSDALYGGAGADQLSAGEGNDTLTGGTGADTFIFTNADRYDYGANVIMDFTRGTDRIDLAIIDARPDLAGDQAFVFQGGFTKFGIAGSLRMTTHDGSTKIYLHTNADGVADVIIDLHSPMTLTASDFIL